MLVYCDRVVCVCTCNRHECVFGDDSIENGEHGALSVQRVLAVPGVRSGMVVLRPSYLDHTVDEAFQIYFSTT